MDMNLLKNSLKSVGITVLLSLILLFTFNFISYSNADPDKMIAPFAYMTLIISVFVCGLLAAKFERERKILCSVTAGGIYIFLIFALSLILRGNNESATPVWLMFVMYLVSIAGVMLGSLAGQSRRKVSPSKTRKNLKNKYTQNLRRKI
jgi:putative membrane protein, TIGR04086 family/integral membrane protein, TIGR04097 family